MIKLFFEGGFLWMSLLTLELIALLLAAWKAPAWVKEIGTIALMTGTVGTLIGFSQMSHAITQFGDISPVIIFGGVKVALITVIYGCFIFMASLIIRIVQKPRI